MKKLKILLKIRDGYLDPFPAYYNAIQQYEQAHGADVLEAVIKPHKSERTLPQNSYYWGVVVRTLADELGYCQEDMHMALRIKFLAEDRGGLTVPKSTTKLDTQEFEEYLERIRNWAVDFAGIMIPLPNEE